MLLDQIKSFFGDIMAIGYRVLKDFLGSINGKEKMLKAGEVLPFEVVEEWKNKGTCINCRYIMEIEIREEKKDEPKNEPNEVF